MTKFFILVEVRVSYEITNEFFKESFYITKVSIKGRWFDGFRDSNLLGSFSIGSVANGWVHVNGGHWRRRWSRMLREYWWNRRGGRGICSLRGL